MVERFMQWLGYGLCHQLPERSFVAGGLQLPVCARDTGIYLGFVFSLLVIGLLHRAERPRGFPSIAGWVAAAVMVGLMAWDGVTSYAGLRATTNDLRLFTGLAAGFAAAAVVVPMVNDGVWRTPGNGGILRPTWKLVVWIAALPAAFLLLRAVGPLLGVAYAAVVAVAIIVTLSAINLVIIGMLKSFDRRADRVRDLWPAFALAVAIAFVEVWLAGRLNAALLGLAERLPG